MSNPLFNIQYGLFVITTNYNGRDNGCICNTVEQVTVQPNRISMSLNKENLTTELIQRSGKFTVSIISDHPFSMVSYLPVYAVLGGKYLQLFVYPVIELFALMQPHQCIHKR